MKSRIAILSLLLTGAAISASAQTKEHYYSEKYLYQCGCGSTGMCKP